MSITTYDVDYSRNPEIKYVPIQSLSGDLPRTWQIAVDVYFHVEAE